MSGLSSGIPFDPSVPERYPETPQLEDILRDCVEDGARLLRVALPVRVVKVRGNQLVDLQPLWKVHYYASPDLVLPPVIGHCPVSSPSGADWFVKYPIAVGDLGTALVADRNLDSWMSGKGEPVDPADVRTHNLSDAIYIPGLLPDSQQTTDTTQDLVIRNGTAQVRLEKNGTFRIANDGQELVDLVGQMNKALTKLVGTLQAAQAMTALGPAPLWAATQKDLVDATTTLTQISSNLQTLQGQ